jgi:hypothetical protein
MSARCGKLRPVKSRGRRGSGARGARPSAETQGLQLYRGSRSRTGSKVQQRFARLRRQIDQRKQRLHAWYDARPAISRELAENHAVLEACQRAGHDLVCLFDRIYPDPIFTRSDRKKLRALICEIASDLLTEQGYDDLKPIYNRHSHGDFDTEFALEDAATARAMKSMMEEVLGMDFGTADVSSMEKLHAFTEAQLRAFEDEQARAQDPGARRNKSAKQLAREARREAEQAKVGKVLQEVHRKLAMALHPDLEQDPAERARKTELMQQVNVAYEAKDLLRLLELQLKLEQIDPDHVSEVAEDRLKHYNTILEQQLKQLEAELDEFEMPWRIELGLLPSTQLSPVQLLARIRVEGEELKQERTRLHHDLEAFQDVSRLKAWLKSPAASERRPARQEDLFR